MSKEFWIAVLKRALWTAAETALAMIPVNVGIDEVGWVHVISVSLTAAIVSALKSIVTGLPEASKTTMEAEG